MNYIIIIYHIRSLLISCIHFSLSLTDLAAFRAAVKRESQSRSQSSSRPRYHSQFSTDSKHLSPFQRQTSLGRQDSRPEPLQRQGSPRSSFSRQGSYRKQASIDGALSKFRYTKFSIIVYSTNFVTQEAHHYHVVCSMEDIPVGAHPSPAPGRVVFGGVDVEVQVGVAAGVVTTPTNV